MNGLTGLEVETRLKTHGYNELPSARPKNIWRIAMEVMKEPMFGLLIICSILYIIIGDYKEGIILLSTVLIIIYITFYQYRKTERALDALRKLSAPQARVIREGKEIRIAGREVVPDDIMLIHEGDRIPADAEVLDAINLVVDESLLTGESVPVTKNTNAIPGDNKIVYSGTMVVQGKATARVIATGINTQFGKIGTSLEGISDAPTRLHKEMRILIRTLFIIGAVISIGVIIAFYLTRGNFINAVLNGLAAAMAILPEEFPVVLTVFLALGAWRLSKKNVLTRKSSAIETLGSATVLCTDKTGTITQNKMEVVALYNGRSLVLKNDFTKQQNEVIGLVETASQASPVNSIDPMEKAIAQSFVLLSGQPLAAYKLLKEYPLSHQLLAMTNVLESATGTRIAAKGAPEAILELCHLNEQERESHMRVVHQLAEMGYRVLGVAKGTQSSPDLPENQHGFTYTFSGLIGFEDPIRMEVPQAIKECSDAGIKVIMITGDFPATAKSIATQIGLPPGHIVSGEELNAMKDDELRQRIGQVNVFARVKPEQKLRLVQALKANKEVVAMTGDGVNDAPALKAADIGIAMGNKGTDVAREASSLVLLDDNFASIVSAARLGRRIFDNLQKAMSYIMAIHIPIIGLTLLPAFFPSLPMLLMPLHIVFMELIIDPVSSVAFESEKEEKGIMKRPPRKPDEMFFGARRILRSVIQGLVLLAMVIEIYFLSIREGHTAGEIRAIAFSSLIIGNIFLILTNLSATRSFLSVFARQNYSAMLILLGASVLLILVIYVPYLRQVFSFQFPGYRHFLPSVLGAFAILFVFEIAKLIRNLLKRKKAVVK